MIFKIALQNLLRQRKQTLLLILFIAVFSFVFLLGISLADTINSGVHRFYSKNITGDYVITASNDASMSVFGSVTPSIGEFVRIPELKQAEEVLSKISAENQIVTEYTPIISGNAILDHQGIRTPVSYFGIDYTTFFDFSQNMQILEGSILDAGSGALVHVDKMHELSEQKGEKLSIGDTILLNVYGDNGFRIREVAIRGVYTYGSGQMKHHIIVDASTARGLQRIFESAENVEVADTQVDLLDMGFDADVFFQNSESDASDLDSDFNLLDSVFDIEIAENPENVTGGWHFILLKSEASSQELSNILEISNGNYFLMDWRQAAGQAAWLGSLFNYFFIGGFVLAVVAGVIGISNVLTISVINRSKEIGTIRALGGLKSYVAGFLFSESAIISIAGGLIGAGMASVIIAMVNSMEVQISNQLLMSIFSGAQIRITQSILQLIQTVICSIIIALPASFIQIRRALAITPLQALTRSK